MARTTTAHIWLQLLEFADAARPLSAAEVKALCARYAWSDRHLSQMSQMGDICSKDGRYYIDRSCAIPRGISYGEVLDAQRKHEARKSNEAHLRSEGE